MPVRRRSGCRFRAPRDAVRQDRFLAATVCRRLHSALGRSRSCGDAAVGEGSADVIFQRQPVLHESKCDTVLKRVAQVVVVLQAPCIEHTSGAVQRARRGEQVSSPDADAIRHSAYLTDSARRSVLRHDAGRLLIGDQLRPPFADV